MFKKLSVIFCAIVLGYYFWGDEKFPAEGTNHVMTVDLYKGTDLADCAYDGHDCSTVSSILPSGIQKGIAGDNKAYLEAMSGYRDSFIFEERSCEVLQRKEIEFDAKDSFVTGTYLMALKCTPIEETSESSTVMDNVTEHVGTKQDKTERTNNTNSTAEQTKESFWN